MIPTVGRIVHYRLSDQDCARINQRRTQARDQRAVRVDHGALIHEGNAVKPGDVYPLIITRTWGDTEGSMVNGQVFLDGNDTLWATSVKEGDGLRDWFVPPRV